METSSTPADTIARKRFIGPPSLKRPPVATVRERLSSRLASYKPAVDSVNDDRIFPCPSGLCSSIQGIGSPASFSSWSSAPAPQHQRRALSNHVEVIEEAHAEQPDAERVAVDDHCVHVAQARRA